MKTFARLTLAKTKDYDAIMRAIASFKLDATVYLRFFRFFFVLWVEMVRLIARSFVEYA